MDTKAKAEIKNIIKELEGISAQLDIISMGADQGDEAYNLSMADSSLMDAREYLRTAIGDE
jgi:chemotaxis methyl-accepting protein methylase